MTIGIAKNDAIGQTARVLLSKNDPHHDRLNGAIGEVAEVLNDGKLIAVRIDGSVYDLPWSAVARFTV